MARMAHIRSVQNRLCKPTDRDHASSTRKLESKRKASRDLAGFRRSVGPRRAGMRRDDVPEQDALLEPELGEDAVDDRRARFRGPVSRQLALRGERDPGDPCAAVAGGFADE